MLSKKLIKKLKMLSCFIKATQEIIENDYTNLSIRNIAQRAHFNSSTIYNYFDNLQQLVCISSFKYIRPHLKDDIFKENFEINDSQLLDQYLEILEPFFSFYFVKKDLSYLNFLTDFENFYMNHFYENESILNDDIESLNEISNYFKEIVIIIKQLKSLSSRIETCKQLPKDYVFEVSDLLFKGMITRLNQPCSNDHILSSKKVLNHLQTLICLK